MAGLLFYGRYFMPNRVTPYEKTTWINRPSTLSPINETNLNHLEQGVKNVTDALNNLVVDIPPATRSTLGGVKVGNNLTVENDGTLNANDQTYTLPTATQSRLGGVKVGNNLSVGNDGTLSAADLNKASESQLGGIKVGRHLTITSDGTLNADDQGGSYTLPKATRTVLGGIKVGDNLFIDENGVLSATGGGGGSSAKEKSDVEMFDIFPLLTLRDPSYAGTTFTIGNNDELTCILNADGSFTVDGETGQDDVHFYLDVDGHLPISGTYYYADDFVGLFECYFAVSQGNKNIVSFYRSNTQSHPIVAYDYGEIEECNKIAFDDRYPSFDGSDNWNPCITAPYEIRIIFKANSSFVNERIFPRFLSQIGDNDQKYFNDILFDDVRTIFRRLSRLDSSSHPYEISNAYGTFYMFPSGYFEVEEIYDFADNAVIDLMEVCADSSFSDISKDIPSNTYFIGGFYKPIEGVRLVLYDSTNTELASDNGIFDTTRNRIGEVDPDFNQILHIYLMIESEHGDLTQLKIRPRFIKYVYESSTQELPIASPSRLGAIKVGDNLDIDDDGVLSAAAHPVGIASSSQLGTVKIGSRLSITSDGVLSANDQSYTLPTASASTKGGVQIGDDINIDSSNGKISSNIFTKLNPVMKANNIPYGDVIVSSENSTSYQGWRAFDETTSSWKSASNRVSGEYIGYKFEEPVRVTRVKITNYTANVKEFKIQGSNNGIDWDDLSDVITNTNSSGEYAYSFNNSNYYSYYRLYVISGYSTSYVDIRELKFYGLNDGIGTKSRDDYYRYVKATPKMTSDTAPSGYTVTYSSRYSSSYNGYRAFDENLASGYEWYSAQNDVVGAWIAIQLPSAVAIRKLAVCNRDNSTPYAVKQFIFQGSNDGTNWTDLGTFNVTSNTRAIRSVFDVNNSDAYTRYRLYITEGWASNYISIAEIEMYAEELVKGDFASEEAIEELFQTNPELPQTNDPIGIKQLAEYDILIKQYINSRLGGA